MLVRNLCAVHNFIFLDLDDSPRIDRVLRSVSSPNEIVILSVQEHNVTRVHDYMRILKSQTYKHKSA